MSLADTDYIDDSEVDDDTGAFLANLTGEKPPGEEEGKKKPAEGEEQSEAGEDAEQGVEKPDEGAKPPEGEADDEGEVELKFGEESKKVSVKEIKRLLSSESDITAKSEAVIQAEQAARVETTRATTALTKMLERAKADFDPYSKLNFFTLPQEVGKDVFLQIQADAQKAYEAVQFFQGELNQLTEATRQEQTASNQKAGAEAVKVLQNATDPRHIPNFNAETYKAITDFAVKTGMGRQAVDAIVDPAALKIIHMAMEYAKAKTSTAEKVEKAVKTPTKILKPSASGKPNPTKSSDAMTKLKRSGSLDDAEGAFMASFRSDD